MSLVYRARPIDRNVDTTWVHVGDEIDFAIRAAGHVIYRPEGAFLVDGRVEPDPRLEAINRGALLSADCVVALLPPGVPTLGVGREIELAKTRGIPVAVVSDGNLWSAADCERWAFSTKSAYAIAEWVGSLPGRAGAGQPLLFRPTSGDDEGFEARLPTRAYSGDAAYDLYVAERTVIPYEGFVDVPCGVHVALPPGVWGRITGRSSTLRRRALLVTEGVIDQGYRGPLFAGVRNLGPRATTIEAGERIAQLILHDLVADRFEARWAADREEFDAVPHDGRGHAGFGSTGG